MAEQIYCIKCKTKTDTENPKKVKSAKGANMLQGQCKVCNCKKSKLIKREEKEEVKEEAKEEVKKEKKKGRKKEKIISPSDNNE